MLPLKLSRPAIEKAVMIESAAIREGSIAWRLGLVRAGASRTSMQGKAVTHDGSKPFACADARRAYVSTTVCVCTYVNGQDGNKHSGQTERGKSPCLIFRERHDDHHMFTDYLYSSRTWKVLVVYVRVSMHSVLVYIYGRCYDDELPFSSSRGQHIAGTSRQGEQDSRHGQAQKEHKIFTTSILILDGPCPVIKQ